MFPGIRLMIAAIAASAVAPSCWFGIFAALRVNHEPLTRLPAASAPQRLVPENAAPAAPFHAPPPAAAEPQVVDDAADSAALASPLVAARD